MKHTPGPWKVGRLRGNDGSWPVAGEDAFIATVGFHGTPKRGETYNQPDPEGEANARLIAAAPELLAACQQAYRTFTGGKDAVLPSEAAELLYAAIAKATGGGE